ncbi:hypothetical protein DRQ25_14025, partial [Candidatus Fermentibacteria bacterium]
PIHYGVFDGMNTREQGMVTGQQQLFFILSSWFTVSVFFLSNECVKRNIHVPVIEFIREEWKSYWSLTLLGLATIQNPAMATFGVIAGITTLGGLLWLTQL